jgi:L-rhamnose-H+ transport protein
MAEHFWLGMLIVFAAGILNGSFTLPMKYTRSWTWENIWSVYSVSAMLVMPWIIAIKFVPNLWRVYHGLTWSAVVYPALFGLLWGIAQTTFGLAINAVGMAMAFAIVCGLVSLTGSLIPILAFNPADLLQPLGLTMLLSLPALLLGLVFYGKAGRQRENEQRASASGAKRQGMSFKTGLALCVFTGIFGSAWNLGFVFSGDTLRRSTEFGATPSTATYAAWALVLSGGFLPNILYPAGLLWHRRTWPLFGKRHWPRELMLGLTMAFLWLGAILSYGIGATFVGKYGTSVGFTLYIATSILASNAIGALTGEWKGSSSRTRKLLAAGISLILVSVAILNLGGVFSRSP